MNDVIEFLKDKFTESTPRDIFEEKRFDINSRDHISLVDDFEGGLNLEVYLDNFPSRKILKEFGKVETIDKLKECLHSLNVAV